MADTSAGESVFTQVQNGILRIKVDETVYSREALLRTCYWFTDRVYLFVDRPSVGFFEVQLKLKTPAPTLSDPVVPKLEDIAGEFLNALLDHQLRQEIEAQTGRIREMIVAKAFAEAGVYEDTPPGDVSDPVDVAKPGLSQLLLKE